MCKLQNFSVCNIVEAAIALFLMSMEEECLFLNILELAVCNPR